GWLSSRLGANQIFDVVRALDSTRTGIVLETEWASVTVRRHRVLDPRHLSRDQSPWRLSRERLRRQRTTRLSVTQRDDLLLAAVGRRAGYRRFVSFRAARGEQRPLNFAP